MNKQLVIDSLGWGFVLWLIGYVLGIAFFFVLPPALVGWAVTPLGLIVTLWVLFRRVKSAAFQHYVVVAVAWTLIAVLFDYWFIVQVFKPADGYYKPDVYLYYASTLICPLLVGWWKSARSRAALAK